jgi:hypothetical protein
LPEGDLYGRSISAAAPPQPLPAGLLAFLLSDQAHVYCAGASRAEQSRDMMRWVDDD